MTGDDYIKQSERHDPDKAKRMMRQYAQLWATAEVTCACGVVCHFMSSYRRLYCGEFFCLLCGQIHFGHTQRDWMKERHPEVLEQLEGEGMVEYFRNPKTHSKEQTK